MSRLNSNFSTKDYGGCEHKSLKRWQKIRKLSCGSLSNLSKLISLCVKLCEINFDLFLKLFFFGMSQLSTSGKNRFLCKFILIIQKISFPSHKAAMTEPQFSVFFLFFLINLKSLLNYRFLYPYHNIYFISQIYHPFQTHEKKRCAF